MSKRMNRAHLKLIQNFDKDSAAESNTAREKAKTRENVTVIDFSSNYSAAQTCLTMIDKLKRIIARLEADNSLLSAVKAERLATLNESLQKFKRGAVAYGESYQDELKKAA